MGATIQAIEYVFPKNKVTNKDLLLQFPEYDFKKFDDKVGISCRYYVDENETGLDLAVQACEKLFQRIDSATIDYILYCTQNPDYILPTTACLLQDRLGLSKNVGALDINLGCSAYTYVLSLAKALINSGQAKNILVVTAETYSKILNERDCSNRAIFGDAATATLVSYTEEENFGDFLFGTDGSGVEKLFVKNGASKYKFESNPEVKTYGSGNFYTDNDLYMNGPEIFHFTGEVVPGFVEELLEANQVEKDHIDQYIFHQANAFMLNFLRKRLKIEEERFFIDLRDGGNTVSSTIPIALKKYSQKITEKETLLLVGFGVGLSWSGGLVTINNKL